MPDLYQYLMCMDAGKNTQWLVPVTVSTASSPREAVHKFVLNAQEETVTVDGVSSDDWLKVDCFNVVLVLLNGVSSSGGTNRWSC